jgi:oxygen-independent coproporphyrinogen-3 oxidase
MDPSSVARIVETAMGLWPSDPDLEISLEANPTDAESGRFADLAAAGVNRLSIGLQSLADEDLLFLGRDHDAAAGRRSVLAATKLFPRVSLDMIYALPGQSPERWAAALDDAVSLGAEHLSPYQLTIEPGTVFDRKARRGSLAPPGEDLAADLYETTQQVLASHGFDAYEVSNHARGVRARSRHNLGCWRGEDYVGVGPGAHGRVTLGGSRFATSARRDIGAYVAAVRDVGTGAIREALGVRSTALERLLMGLRTTEGVTLSELAPLDLTADRLERVRGWAEVRDGRLVATSQGRPVLNAVIAVLADAA